LRCCVGEDEESQTGFGILYIAGIEPQFDVSGAVERERRNVSSFWKRFKY
jgi:hypothetical protein